MSPLLIASWAATYSQLIPALVTWRRWRTLPANRKWVVIWCLLLFIADVTAWLVGRITHVNLGVRIITMPVMDATLLWTLSLWQVSYFGRLLMRIAIALVIPTWLGFALFFDGPRQFGTVSAPLRDLVLLLAALYTLLTRAYYSTERPLRADWLWITIALCIYFALAAALEPLAAALYATKPDLVGDAFLGKAVVDIVVFSLIAAGLLCPLPRQTSGQSI